MAKQSGIIKLEGTVGGISFYKSQDGYLAREKGGPTAEKIKTDPNFQRTRENGAEFGRAGAAGRLLRTVFRSYLQDAADNRMVSRLTKDMVAVVKADATSQRGQRNVLDGELEMLEGFDFNINSKLARTMYAPFTPVIDREGGTQTVSMPEFIPLNAIAFPLGTTHVKFITAGAEIDFENERYNISTAESQEIALDATQTPVITLATNLTPASLLPIFLIMGIVFYQEVNGVKYTLKNGYFNCLSIVKVAGY